MLSGRPMLIAPSVGCSLLQPSQPLARRSVGCILAELLGRRPMFAGKDYIHQLHLIMQVRAPVGNCVEVASKRIKCCSSCDLRQIQPAMLLSF